MEKILETVEIGGIQIDIVLKTEGGRDKVFRPSLTLYPKDSGAFYQEITLNSWDGLGKLGEALIRLEKEMERFDEFGNEKTVRNIRTDFYQEIKLK